MSAPCLPVIHRKRKRNDIHDTNSLSNCHVESSLEANEDEVTFDDIETIDAAEYLSRVVNQAKQIPDIFVSQATKCDKDVDTVIPKRHQNHVPIDGSAADIAYLVSGRASLTRPPTDDFLPFQKLKWIKSTISNFERLRAYLDDCREKGVGGKLTNRTILPPMKDRSGWHLFCVGSDEANGNIKSYFGDDYDNSNLVWGRGRENMEEKSDEQETNLPVVSEWQRNLPSNGYEPCIRLLSQMDQVLVRRVLGHLCHYTAKGWKMTQQRSAWIYALLARLEKPIHRDDASNLFGLLKSLTLARSKLDVRGESRTELVHLNVLITLVGIYFEQGGNVSMSVA